MKTKPKKEPAGPKVATTRDLPSVDYSFIGMNAEQYLDYLRNGKKYQKKGKKSEDEGEE